MKEIRLWQEAASSRASFGSAQKQSDRGIRHDLIYLLAKTTGIRCALDVRSLSCRREDGVEARSSGQAPKRSGKTTLFEKLLVVFPGMWLEFRVKTVTVPRLRELPNCRCFSDVAVIRGILRGPAFRVVSIAEDADHRAGSDNVIPPLGGRFGKSNGQSGGRGHVGSGIEADLGAAIGAGAIDPDIDAERGADAKRIPGTSSPPAAVIVPIKRSHHEGHRRGREWMRHPDRVTIVGEYQGVVVGERAERIPNTFLVTLCLPGQFRNGRSTALIREGFEDEIADVSRLRRVQYPPRFIVRTLVAQAPIASVAVNNKRAVACVPRPE